MSGGGVDSVNDPQQVYQTLLDLLSAEQVDKAASLYSRLSEDLGYYLVQRLAKAPRVGRRLAKMFYLAKDFEKSALVFEELEDFKSAAKLYKKADDYGMAAEMYAKVEDFQNAAPMYEKHGNYATAAELYQQVGDLGRAAANFEKAVNHFQAGKTYFALGKGEKAVELLQKIGPDDFNYIEAVLMVNRSLAEGGYRGIAIRKLGSLLEERGLVEATLDVALTLADLAIAEGEGELAREWLQRILEVKFPYKNAADLLKQLEAGAAAPPPPVAEVAVLEVEPLPDEPDSSAAPIDEPGPIVALEEDFQTIRDAPLFQELNLQELKKFWTLVMPLDFAAGEIIIEQDEPGTGLYIISSGDVTVARVDGDKQEVLAELGAGAHLGEMSLLDETPTSARVTAGSDVDAFVMPKDAFQQLIDSDDRLARKIYQAFAGTLMSRLRDTNQQFKSYQDRKQTEMADIFGNKEG